MFNFLTIENGEMFDGVEVFFTVSRLKKKSFNFMSWENMSPT